MLKRKIVSKLEKWKSNSEKKALLVKGARQVGKTTIIRQFAKEHYENVVEINFEQKPTAKRAFEGDLDAKTLLMNLSALGFGPFVAGKTLLFLDEIQSCPKARTAIKFLVEDGRFDVIESGSLLGLNYKDVSSYPVGFEHKIDMYPLDFEEFLWACGVSDDVTEAARSCFVQKKPVSSFLHEQLMTRFRQFLIVGGMPDVVNSFVTTADFNQVGIKQEDIINSYRDDIAKYADKEKTLAKSVFDAIPAQLSKQDKRFVLSNLEKGGSQRKYASPIQWLINAGDAYYSFNVSALEVPLSLYEKRNLYKLFLLDTGLLCNMAMRAMQFDVMSGKIDINEGALTENFVACELVKHGHDLNYYDRKSKQELDFIYANGNKIALLEVKSGDTYHIHASLDAALRTSGDKISDAIVLCKGNLEIVGSIVYMPLYMTMFL